LAPLRQLPLLRDLELCVFFGDFVSQFAADLRALHWLHRLHVDGTVLGTSRAEPAALLHALLPADPKEQLCALQWRQFDVAGLAFTDELTPSLLRLPSLERLEADLSSCTGFDFLSALPRLTSLDVRSSWMNDSAWSNLLGVFVSDGLAHLHTLQLRGGPCTSNDLAQLLSRTPALTSLTLDELKEVSSLFFFRRLPKLAETLRHLTVDCANCGT
jgi:hypothetical protein